MRITLFRIAALILGLFSSRAWAIDVETHGFFTLGYSISNSNVPYLDTITRDGDFAAISDAGFQFATQLDSRISAKLQFLSQGRHDSSFTPTLDLGQVSYLFSSSHEVLMGRLRLPLFLVSEYRNVGTLYPWTLPPPEVYDVLPATAVGKNDTFTGVNFLNRLAEQGLWTVDSEIFGGGSEQTLSPPQQEINTKIKRLFGATVSLNSPDSQIRLAYLNSLNKATTITNGASGATTSDSSLGVIQFLSLGGRWEPKTWLLMTEGTRIFSENIRFKNVYSGYITGGYRFWRRKFLVHETIGTVVDAAHSGSGLGQTSYTTGLNYSFNDSAVFKFEWQRAYPSRQDPPPPAPPGAPAQSSGSSGPTLYGSTPPSSVDVFHLSISASF